MMHRVHPISFVRRLTSGFVAAMRSVPRRFVVIGIVLLFMTVSGIAYGIIGYATRDNTPDVAVQNIDNKEADSSKSDAEGVTAPAPDDTDATSDASGSAPLPTNSTSTHAPSTSTSDFSLVLSTNSVEILPGIASPVITVSTSDGRPVSWGPSSLGEKLYVLVDVDLRAPRAHSKSSYTFQVITGSQWAAGTYTLPITGYDSRSGTRLTANLSVTVKTPRSFDISLGAEQKLGMPDGTTIYVPFAVTRSGGHDGWVSASAVLVAVPTWQHNVSYGVSLNDMNHGVVTIHVPFDTPVGEYVFNLWVTDGTITRQQLFAFEI